LLLNDQKSLFKTLHENLFYLEGAPVSIWKPTGFQMEINRLEKNNMLEKNAGNAQ